MKLRFILSIMFVCFGLLQSKADTYTNNANNTIYISDASVKAGEQLELKVNMKNNVQISGFQFDMYLPEGITVDNSIDSWGDVSITAKISGTRVNPNKFTFECSFPEANNYRHLTLLCYATNANVASGDGEVATININVDDKMASGKYDVTLRNVVVSNTSDTYDSSHDFISVLTVHNAGGASNSVDLIDGEPFTNITTSSYDELTFTKTFSASAAGNWNAFYVPMSVDVEEYAGDLDFAEIYAFCATVDTNGDGVVDANDDNFLFVRPVKTGSIKPNVPYLIRPREAKTYVINSADNVLYKATEGKVEFGTTIEKYTVTGLNNSFTVTAGDNNFYVSATGKLNYRTTGSTTVKANRWIMHRESQEYGGGNNNDIAGAKEYRIITIGEDMDEATAIKAINASNANNSGVYTLDGRKVNDVKSLPNGIYIKDGNKIFINN